MTHRLTCLLLLPVILILSFTPSKQFKNPEVKKSTSAACTSTFTLELSGCQTANFVLEYIIINGTRFDMNIGCSNYSGPTYIGALSFVNGPANITVHSSVGVFGHVQMWDHRGSWDGSVGNWFPFGSRVTNTLSFSTEVDLIGCGEDYTLAVRVKN